MNETKRLAGPIGFLLCGALLGALTGCVAYESGPRQAGGYGPPPSMQMEAGVVVLDDYVYYPRYQVYYSSSRRQYVYQEGRSWMWRPAPPHVSIEALHASPSVRLDFHDSPAAHHASVVRQYPNKWAPPGGSPNRDQGNRGDGRGNDRGNRD